MPRTSPCSDVCEQYPVGSARTTAYSSGPIQLVQVWSPHGSGHGDLSASPAAPCQSAAAPAMPRTFPSVQHANAHVLSSALPGVFWALLSGDAMPL